MAEDQENYLSDGSDPRLPRKQAEIEAQAEDQHNTEVAKKRAEYEALQLRHRAMMDALTANTKSMFGKTPPEVSVNALALAAFLLVLSTAPGFSILNVWSGVTCSTGSPLRSDWIASAS